jgi:hypothetical protein
VNRDEIFKKYGGRCAYCGRELGTIKQMQVDHIIPRFKGGTDDLDNLAPACRTCNNFKRSFTVEEFRNQLIGQIAVLHNNSTAFRRAIKYNLIAFTGEPVVFYFEKDGWCGTCGKPHRATREQSDCQECAKYWRENNPAADKIKEEAGNGSV